ncbi:MAG: DnaJ domain-containing protein [Candidatus Zixiibacteriota bacterium]
MEQWKCHWKDYYKILQVHPSAEPEVIEVAFKKLSLKYHPDQNKGSKEAEEKFKEINEAHETLKDPEKRGKYASEWSKRVGKPAEFEDTHEFPKPKPVVDPSHIDFRDVSPGEIQKATFVIRNNGGPYSKIWFSNPNSWLSVVTWGPLTPDQDDELPLQVEIEAQGEDSSNNYSEIIRVRLDEEETRIRISLQTKPPPQKQEPRFARKFISAVAVTGVILMAIILIQKEKSQPPPQAQFVFRPAENSQINMRREPLEWAEVVATISVYKGQPLGVFDTTDGWYKIGVKRGEKVEYGWIRISMIDTGKPPRTPPGSQYSSKPPIEEPPIEERENVTVWATQKEVYAGMSVKEGDSLIFSADSKIDWDEDKGRVQTGPIGISFEGTTLFLPQELLSPSSNIGCLLGKIGKDGSWFHIGNSKRMKAQNAGNLYLTFNRRKNDDRDASGSFTVEIVRKTKNNS